MPQQVVLGAERLLAILANVLARPSVNQLDVLRQNSPLFVHLAAEMAGVFVAGFVRLPVLEHGVLAVEALPADITARGAVRVDGAVPRQRRGHLERLATVVTSVHLLRLVGVLVPRLLAPGGEHLAALGARVAAAAVYPHVPAQCGPVSEATAALGAGELTSGVSALTGRRSPGGGGGAAGPLRHAVSAPQMELQFVVVQEGRVTLLTAEHRPVVQPEVGPQVAPVTELLLAHRTLDGRRGDRAGGGGGGGGGGDRRLLGGCRGRSAAAGARPVDLLEVALQVLEHDALGDVGHCLGELPEQVLPWQRNSRQSAPAATHLTPVVKWTPNQRFCILHYIVQEMKE